MKAAHVALAVGGVALAGGAVYFAARSGSQRPYTGAAGSTGSTAGDLLTKFGGSFLSRLGDSLGSQVGSQFSGGSSSSASAVAALGTGTDGFSFTDDNGDFIAG